MDKNSNDWIILGVFLLVIGLILAVYSIATYTEIKSLGEKIDFELIDDNKSLSSSEKYYKYLTIADYLNQNISKNKNLPIKNSSCVYLDFAQHNAIELYTLTDTRLEADEYKLQTATENVKALRTLLDSYNTCPKSKLYKAELDKILTDSEKKNRSIEQQYEYQSFE